MRIHVKKPNALWVRVLKELSGRADQERRDRQTWDYAVNWERARLDLIRVEHGEDALLEALKEDTLHDRNLDKTW